MKPFAVATHAAQPYTVFFFNFINLADEQNAGLTWFIAQRQPSARHAVPDEKKYRRHKKKRAFSPFRPQKGRRQQKSAQNSKRSRRRRNDLRPINAQQVRRAENRQTTANRKQNQSFALFHRLHPALLRFWRAEKTSALYFNPARTFMNTSCWVQPIRIRTNPFNFLRSARRYNV